MAQSPKPDDELQQALQEAVEAVEAEERADETLEGMLEVGDDDDDDDDEDPDPIDDDDDDGDDPPEAGSALMGAKAELDEVLNKTQKESQELREKWLRAAADLENYRKRAARERDEIVRFGNERLLKEFLQVADDLDRTLEAGQENATVQSLLEGVSMVSKKLLVALEKHGVTTFSASGEAFDPTQHEAVHQVHSDEVPAGGVAAELRRGYFLNGRLLRPAMVAVSLGPDGGSKDDEGGED